MFNQLRVLALSTVLLNVNLAQDQEEKPAGNYSAATADIGLRVGVPVDRLRPPDLDITLPGMRSALRVPFWRFVLFSPRIPFFRALRTPGMGSIF